MNNALFEALQTPATLEDAGRGKLVLVRKSMIDHFTGIVDSIDTALAQIPQLLAKYKLQEFDTEPLQRSILQDGFAAVEAAVESRTLRNLEKSGLFPKLQKELAARNVECIPQGLRPELEAACREIQGLISELDIPVDLGALWFRSGKLRVPPKYREDIAPRYTVEVSTKQRKAVEKFRKAAEAIAELKAEYPNLRYSDYHYQSPDGRTYINSGIISRLANGDKYTDAELLGLLQGIELTH